MHEDDFMLDDACDPAAPASPPPLGADILAMERAAFVWALGSSTEAEASLDHVAKAPRILQIAIVAAQSDQNATRSTAAEIVRHLPALAVDAAAWSAMQCNDTRELLGLDLARQLQAQSAAEQSPALQRLATTVLMLSIATPLIRVRTSKTSASEMYQRIKNALAAILPKAPNSPALPEPDVDDQDAGPTAVTADSTGPAIRLRKARRKPASHDVQGNLNSAGPLVDRLDLRSVALRVLSSLMAARRSIGRHWPTEFEAFLDRLIIGWAMLAHGVNLRHISDGLAHMVAVRLGEEQTEGFHRHMVERRQAAVAQAIAKRDEAERKAETDYVEQREEPLDEADPASVIVCGLSSMRFNSKDREIFGGHEHMLNKPVRVVQIDDLPAVRKTLLQEFPYAETVVDRLLADLVGRTDVVIRPALIHGKPGGGKTHFVRRFAENLGLHIWVTDGSSADGAVFGGTERRWQSAEPNHPFLAMSRGRMANPLMLIDEIEKAAVRTDYGRLWDALLPFLEPSSAKAIQDKALQVPVDCSRVNYIATANSLSGLPPPLLDRFRVVTFAEPTIEHLGTLIPQLLSALAERRSLDPRFIEPLTVNDHDWIERHWRGGSIRRLSRLLEAIINARERSMPRQ